MMLRTAFAILAAAVLCAAGVAATPAYGQQILPRSSPPVVAPAAPTTAPGKVLKGDEVRSSVKFDPDRRPASERNVPTDKKPVKEVRPTPADPQAPAVSQVTILVFGKGAVRFGDQNCIGTDSSPDHRKICSFNIAKDVHRISLHGEPAPGMNFAYWVGETCEAAGMSPICVTDPRSMDDSAGLGKHVEAHFLPGFVVTVHVEGLHGRVVQHRNIGGVDDYLALGDMAHVPSIDCAPGSSISPGQTCEILASPGYTLQLEADGAAGVQVKKFDGPPGCTGTTCKFKVSTKTTITAHLAEGKAVAGADKTAAGGTSPATAADPEPLKSFRRSIVLPPSATSFKIAGADSLCLVTLIQGTFEGPEDSFRLHVVGPKNNRSWQLDGQNRRGDNKIGITCFNGQIFYPAPRLAGAAYSEEEIDKTFKIKNGEECHRNPTRPYHDFQDLHWYLSGIQGRWSGMGEKAELIASDGRGGIMQSACNDSAASSANGFTVAKVVINFAPSVPDPDMNPYMFTSHGPTVSMASANYAICGFTSIAGKFRGGSEWAEIKDVDGFWRLSTGSGQGGIVAKADCIMRVQNFGEPVVKAPSK